MGTGCRSATSSLFLDLPYNIKFRLVFFVLFVIFLYRDGGETTSGLGGWMDGWDSDGMRDARSW